MKILPWVPICVPERQVVERSAFHAEYLVGASPTRNTISEFRLYRSLIRLILNQKIIGANPIRNTNFVPVTQIDRVQPCIYLVNRDELARFVSEGNSIRQIAKIRSMSASTIRYFLKKFEIKTKSKRGRKPWNSLYLEQLKTKFPWNKIKIFYNQGHSANECLSKFGVNSCQWKTAVKLSLVSRRSKSDSISLRVSSNPWTNEMRIRASERMRRKIEKDPSFHPNFRLDVLTTERR